MRPFLSLAEMLFPLVARARANWKSKSVPTRQSRRGRRFPAHVECLENRRLLTTYTNAVPLAIDDVSTVSSQIPVSSTSHITDVNVTLNISHTWDSDLDVTLIAPDGTRVVLFQDLGGSSDNFSTTTFDDEAGTQISSGSAPFNGTFRPSGSLSILDGKVGLGNWRLEITDDAGGDEGTLNNWSLDISYAAAGSVTVVSHGASISGSGGPLETLGAALFAHYDAGASTAALYNYDPATGGLTIESGTPNADNKIILFDWEAESDHLDPGYDEAAGDALFAMLVQNNLLGSDYLHLIGHSRGTVVVSEAAQRLLQYYYTVDQMTLLDEEPGFGPLDDAGPPKAWEGIGFVDNYWGDGTAGLQGERIDGAYNHYLSGQSHSGVRDWYTTTVTNSGIQQGFYWRTLPPAQQPASDGPKAVLEVAPGIINGDFEYYDDSVTDDPIAGWEYQGGSGDADNIVVGPGDHALLLEPFEATRIHNRLYIPGDARALEYQIDVPTQGDGDVLTVSIGSTVLETVPLSLADVSSGTGRRFFGTETHTVSIPANLRNLVNTLTFTVSAPGALNVLTAHVVIDNVRFAEASGVSVVEIIDRSGSMFGQPLQDAKTAASLFVQLLNPGDEIGVASFETSAMSNFNLTEVGNDGVVKQQAINAINAIDSTGSTAIGLGLRVGQGVLNPASYTKRALILMSDGYQNSGPDPLSVIDAEIPADVQIFTIAFGTSADEVLLQQIAQRRNGLFFAAPTGADLSRIYDIIAAAVSGDVNLNSTTGGIHQNETQTQSFYVDPSVSQFRVSVNYPGSDLDLELVTPQGTLINHAAMAGNPDLELIEGATFEVVRVNQPLVGTWQVRIIGKVVTGSVEPFTLTTVATTAVRVELQPVAQPVTLGTSANLEVDVVDGTAVLGASVVATLQPSTGAPIVVTLVDDGLHGDGAANDGRYGQSVLFNQGSGNYFTSIQITGTDNSGTSFVRSLTTSIVVGFVNPPVIPAGQIFSLSENSPFGTGVGNVLASDPGASPPLDTLTYSLTNNPGNAFAIDGSTGQLTVLTPGALNFETTPQIVVGVSVMDGRGAVATQTIVVQVTNVNEAPTNLTLTNNIVLENLTSGSAVGTFNSTDPDQTNTFTYTLVTGTGSNDNGSFTLSNGQLLTATTFDFDVKTSYSIRVRSTDQGGLSIERQFTLTVTNVNEAPTNLLLSSTSVTENNAPNTNIGTLTATDPDSGNTFLFSLVTGTGSTDNASFSILGNSLRILPTAHFATKNSYSIRLQVADQNGLTFQKQFTINVLKLNEAPTDISLSATTLAENNVPSAEIGILNATDADAGSTFTYSLVPGLGSTDNASFTISGNSLKIIPSADFETQKTYSVRIRVTDQGALFFEESFNISVTDVTEAPTNIILSPATIEENNTPNTVVGTLSAIDADAGGSTFTYSLVAGPGSTDNGSFTLTGNTLTIVPVTSYANKKTYSIRVQVTDQTGLTFQKALVVSVLKLNEAPSDIQLSGTSIAENNAPNATVVTLSASDTDAANTFTFTLVPGLGSNDNASFFITGNTLQIIPSANFETQRSYALRIRATDQGGLFVEKSVTIDVTDVPEAPTDITLSPDSVTENNPANGLIGTLTAADDDVGNTFTFALAAGTGSTDNASVTIVGNVLRIIPRTNFEIKNSYAIRVRVTDQSGLAFEKPLTINVTDVNEAPTNIALSTASIVENNAPNAVVGTLTPTDPDANNTFLYSLVVGTGSTDNASFSISGDVLRIIPVTNAGTKNSYSIRLQVADQDGLTFQKQLTINITDVNAAPTNIALSSTSIPENNAANSAVATLSAVDPDPNNSFSFVLAGGQGSTDNTSFAIQGNTLVIFPSTNFETKSSYSIRLRVTDQDGQSFEKPVTITVDNVPEAPTNLNLSQQTIAENQPVGTSVGTFSTTDPDSNETFTYSLVTGNGSTDNGSFFISNGVLKTTSALDYETKNSYSIRVRTTDKAGLTFEKPLTIEVTDSNDAPTELELSSTSIAENNPTNATIGTLTASDPDSGNTFTFDLVGGIGDTDNASFTISGNVLKVLPSTDFETKSNYAIRLQVTDQGGQTFEKAFNITILNRIDAPTNLSLTSASITENNPTNAVVGTLTATDPDPSSAFTFRLASGAGDNDNASVLVVGNTVRMASITNFEAKSSYAIRVRVTDQDGLFFENALLINIVDVNEAPTIVGLADRTIPEDSVTDLVQFLVADPETAAETLTLSATSSNPSLIPDANIVFSGTGASRGVIVTPAANHHGSATITVTVSDGTTSSSETFQVTVQSVDDPTIISTSSQPLVYLIASKKVVTIDGQATISDSDSPNLMFNGAVLTVSGQGGKDTLSLVKQNGLGLKGKTVLFGGVAIGTLAGGKKSAPLTVHLNGAATQSAVQSLMQSIGFKSVDKLPGTRTLQFQITGLGGKNTNPATKSIQVIPK